ncbi:MAG: hypothetical protein IKA46_06270 [Clostridia bacterium]|nr:hypothetical protein [Clostridia bacterium]
MTYGIIKNKDASTYVSPIFALKYAGWKSEAIVFDETFTQIKKLHIWNTGIGIHRNIFLLENDYGFDKKDWAGLDWVINDKKLFKALRFGKNASTDLFSTFKNYTRKIELPDHFELKTDKDIFSLEEVSMGFHDSLICQYTEIGNDIIVEFDTTWDCHITVTFEGVIEADFKEKVGQILDSEIKKNEDGFTFTVTDGFAGWIDGCDYDAEMGEPYIKCKKIFWQIEIT